VALTPAGEAFLVEARRILQQVDHARRSLEVAAAS
jgi:DNA-binding transcriptional LysR family regulator